MKEDIKIINKDGEMKEITIPLPKNLELQHNQRIKKINGKWYKVTYPEGSKIMEEDIKVLEEMLDIDKHLGKFLSDNRRQAIENLIKGYKELVKENINLNDELQMTKNSIKIANLDVLEDYLPKSKVSEYLNKMEKRCDKPKFSVMKKEIEELLQEGDK